MTRPNSSPIPLGRPILLGASALCLVLALPSCDGDDGDRGPQGPAGTSSTGTAPTPTELSPEQDAPGIVLTILDISGAHGQGGNFQSGDTVSVDFRAEKLDGDPWDLSEFTGGRIMISGPTFNYQRVIPEQNDVLTRSVNHGGGSYTYTFADPLPATYVAPLNDSPSFGPGDGELTGQPLLAGTYTVGLYTRWDYTVEGESFRDAGNVEEYFLLGATAAILPREVVKQDNCNQCHDSLRAHGRDRRDVGLCILCHTVGSEDRNNPAFAGGTPGVTIDFRTMIHKIHNGAHLPSVNGVGVEMDGSRDYDVPPEPYLVVGFNNSIHDFSGVEFPAWPNGQFPMARDAGYAALTPAQQGVENVVRTAGVTSCDACHGDPDGAGPLTAPSQGDLIYSAPTRNACGSCHDDIDWDLPYTANLQTMPAQADDSACTICHGVSGSMLDVVDAHTHPLDNPMYNPGLNFELTDLVEAGANNGDGTIDVGEKIAAMLRITDDAGVEVDPVDIASMSMVISGPSSNYNLVLNSTFPTAALSGPQPYAVDLPELQQLELVGHGTAGVDSFSTALRPHWNVAGALTTVYTAAETGGADTLLASDATPPQNYIDIVNAAGFDRDDYISIGNHIPGQEEFLRIQYVEGNRLWFSSPYSQAYAPGIRLEHSAGAATPVAEVSVTELVAGVDYTLDEATGTITEIGAGTFGLEEVVATYTSDFVMPATYPLPLNGSPELDETWGEWAGKSLVDGTYSAGVWGYRTVAFNLFGESNSYRGSAPSVSQDFLFGSASTMEPYDLISSAQNCNACHQDLWFHGGTRRGFDSCLLCHGTAGSEDRPQYVAANAPATSGVTVNLRTMLHKIHMGEELFNASSYTLVGFGLGYPNNFSEHTYEHVVFPNMPSGVQNCESCHGSGNEAWKSPADRNHPTEQGSPVRAWRAVCGSCHDSEAAAAHIDVQTSASGIESCTVCHGIGDALDVELSHKVRR